ncbi:thioesterase superfamily protein [Gloeothece citriformis PCC 7424]|uniref:Thioesterase superfamily protein n=1 Tax=Gloeothece citriformis (strain PCC 7424) TaxID=65393 RepID=B7K9P6_GLOC7|nr:thioesterase family protein [Gloeothece citriformis]ACK70014.1 thioesterase superfamily protein [Gloeothece citriformis PCC 7424]
MSEQTPPQLPPTTALSTDNGLRVSTENWFEYPIRVQPHHTDYEGVVWHGTYITWMEEARVECLRSMGINYADLVKMGCVLPVVELSLRYHSSLKLGEEGIVKTRMDEIAGVKINWDYKIQSPDAQQLYVSGRVTLVAIDAAKGKIMRQLPPEVKEVLIKLTR